MLSAPMGRYLTPLMAMGIRSGMMMALKIKAERIALPSRALPAP